MFYCNECGRERNWPTNTFGVSVGVCEICGKKRICNDIQSKLLPKINTKEKSEDELKTNKTISTLQRKIKRLEKRICNNMPTTTTLDIVQIKAELQVKIIEWLRENKNNLKFNFGLGDPDLTALFMTQAAWQIIEARRIHPTIKKV